MFLSVSEAPAGSPAASVPSACGLERHGFLRCAHWVLPIALLVGTTPLGIVALQALEIGVPERLRAKSARLGLPPATYYASARSQSCFSDPKFRYRPRPSENCCL